MFTAQSLSRDSLEDATEFLIRRLPRFDDIELVVQLGSGHTAVDLLDEIWERLPLQQMPHLPNEESLARHELEILWGRLGDAKVLVYVGRYHLYEGFGMIPVVLPVWAAAACGAKNFLFTNASGAVNPHLKPGSFMVITDHVNNLGVSPLIGHQHLVKSPFVDMSGAYSPTMAASFLKAAAQEDEPVYQGVYMANTGPQFETPAELLLAKQVGADAIGMSTVLEVTVAYAMEANILAVSTIKNSAYGLVRNTPPTVDEGAPFHRRLVAIIRRWVQQGGHAESRQVV